MAKQKGKQKVMGVMDEVADFEETPKPKKPQEEPEQLELPLDIDQDEEEK